MPFHLYMNAFENDESLFFREARSGGFSMGGPMPKGHWGWIRVEDVTMDSSPLSLEADPPAEAPADRTVVWVPLPRAVRPGGRVEISLRFQTKLPEIRARTGFAGSFFMLAQWFPKVGVLTDAGWRCEPFHAFSEFFSDFGTYDVTVTIPKGYQVVATGLERERREQGGKVLHRFHADRVHDFSLAAGRDMTILERSARHAVGPGSVRLAALATKGRTEAARHHLELLAHALRIVESWLGRYPYPSLSMVVPPEVAANAAGMEYPTLFVTAPLMRRPGWLRSHESENVTVHEFLHQYFQGMVASDEARHAWMDEGLTTFMTGLVMDRLFGAERSRFAGRFLSIGEFAFMRLGLALFPPISKVLQPSWRYCRHMDYGIATYAKTSLALRSVMGLVGRDEMLTMMRAYVQRWAFRHPEPKDFFTVVRDVLGPDVEALLVGSLESAGLVGYQVASVTVRRSRPSKGFFDGWLGGARPAVPQGFVSEVLVTRKGDLSWPVEILFHFADGEEIRRQWDGQDRWKRFRFHRPARLAWAVLDPDRKLWLDPDRLDDGIGARAGVQAARSLSVRYWGTVQILFQVLGL